MTIPKLYDKYFINKEDERRHLFQILSERYDVTSGIYPGSFVHITPAFFIPEIMFIDNDKRINRFFSDAKTIEYINKNKTFESEANITWLQEDFTQSIDLKEKTYDIMFSFYAGFISQHCKQFLKKAGILIANNSHGDATIAISDSDYECIGIILRNNQKFRIKTDEIQDYITKKDGSDIDIQKVKQKMTGEKFAKNAYAYIFKKISN